MKNGKQTVVLIGIIVISLVVALLWNYWSKSKKNKSETSQTENKVIVNLTNVDPKSYDALLKQEYVTASEKAIEANPDYKIADIETTIGASLQPTEVNTRYVFTNPNDAKNNWVFTVSLSSQKFIRALIAKEDYIGELQPFDLKSWKFSYISALQYAEKNGGLQWRENNSLSQIVITFKNDAKNTPVWKVDYKGTNDSLLTIQIDPTTGDKISS